MMRRKKGLALGSTVAVKESFPSRDCRRSTDASLRLPKACRIRRPSSLLPGAGYLQSLYHRFDDDDQELQQLERPLEL